MIARNWAALLWSGLWLAVMAAALTTRPPMPVDETRYLAVAWDMWLSGDYLVPHLNGETYSHKPPLLFWLINAGWAVFGVNEWWPRLVAPAFGLANLFLTARLARELWPGFEQATHLPRIDHLAPLLLFGGFFWALFTTLTMFDMILAFCTLLALLGIVQAWRGNWLGFVLMGAAIGLGVLTKGPAIFLHTLPVALSATWWGKALIGAKPQNKSRWYVGVLAAVLMGACIGLAWAVPAGMAGGEAYRDAIFWGQSAGRIVSSFAHKQSWWWYGATLPLLLLPWVLWPPAWRAAKGFRKLSNDGGARLCAVWFLSAVVVFSAISGKQFHYLLPEMPAIALILARLLYAGDEKKPMPPLDQAVPGLFAVICGTVLIGLPTFGFAGAPSWLNLLASMWGLVLVVAGFAVVLTAKLPLSGRIGAIATLSAVFVIVSHLALKPPLAAVYDLKPLALKMAEWQRQGIALANFSKYHGQYNFLGRLETPVTEVGMLYPDTEKFIKANPKALIIAYHRALPTAAKPIAVYRFRTRLIAVWEASVVARHPGITER
ncbi:MAG: glycosyltransferase family 39 protein [Rhodospirillales bacterium]|nr:glycosyltransferase family 39 protein [Rhodospirillales bacterium]